VRELRIDPLSGTWVLIAPERSRRPGSDRHRRRSKPWPTQQWVASCPFCPGNERLTPPEIARVAAPSDAPGWQVRAFANRYPILDGGAHEVVVLTPRHDGALATMPPEQAALALRMLQERMRAHLSAGKRYVEVFVNHDPAAGASVDHPHAQVVALDAVPPLLEHEASALSGDTCVLCQAIAGEGRRESPLAVLSGDPAAWCPSWSAAAFELIVAPRAHRARFEEADGMANLAGSVSLVLACLDHAAGDPAYNLVVHTAAAGMPDFHWHLHVRPRLSEPGGFELGTGIAVAELAPQDAARALRSALALRWSEGSATPRPG
jgi:UDPglucose--hexose-1-phosphate uridylyltransferase